MKVWLVVVLAMLVGACSDGRGATDTPAVTTGRPTTAVATPRPAPVPTERPTPEPTLPTFDPIALLGKGSKVAKFLIPEGIPAIGVVAYAGSSNFAVWTVAADGSETSLLVNTIGKYKGTVLFDFDGEHAVAFKIEASGSWTIAIKPVSSAPIWDPSVALKGTGDAVLLLRPAPSGLTTIDFAYKGDSNFAVWSYSPSGVDLLANEIGPWSGQSLLPDGTVLLAVTAEGSWTATTG